MLTPEMIDRLNHQINLEYYSSNLYLQMSAWCNFKGYTGSADFLRVQATEELMHMHKLFDYVCECGALPTLGTIEAPTTEYASLEAIFKETFAHEKKVTAAINVLADFAFNHKDFATFQFLQWYVAEQHEEEHLSQSILDKIAVIGMDGKGIYFLDKEIRKLATSSSAS